MFSYDTLLITVAISAMISQTTKLSFLSIWYLMNLPFRSLKFILVLLQHIISWMQVYHKLLSSTFYPPRPHQTRSLISLS